MGPMGRHDMKTTMTALLALAAAPALADGHAVQWDMPMAYAASNFHSEMGAQFADKVREYTDGAVDITVHAGGSLFGGGEIKRAIQTGQVPIGERLMSAHANEDPILAWDNVPFVATSFDENEALWQAAKPTVEETLAEQNLRVLYTCPWPGQGFYFNKPVDSSDDTQGVKFRSYNTATATFAEALGMVPVQVEAAELSQALATGVAEAFISSGATGYDRKVWEHLSHYYKVNAWMPRNYVMVNAGAWDDLSDEARAGIEQAAAETGEACRARSEELTNFYFDELEKNGMTVTDASGAFADELQEIGASMQEQWLADTGEAGQAIMDAYMAN